MEHRQPLYNMYNRPLCVVTIDVHKKYILYRILHTVYCALCELILHIGMWTMATLYSSMQIYTRCWCITALPNKY